MIKIYRNNLQHVQEELKRIDILVNLQVEKFRYENKIMNEFQGIYISDEEVDSLLDPSSQPASNKEHHTINTLKTRLIQLESQIAQKKVNSLKGS
jgi:hypothetical protein